MSNTSVDFETYFLKTNKLIRTYSYLYYICIYFTNYAPWTDQYNMSYCSFLTFYRLACLCCWFISLKVQTQEWFIELICYKRMMIVLMSSHFIVFSVLLWHDMATPFLNSWLHPCCQLQTIFIACLSYEYQCS